MINTILYLSDIAPVSPGLWSIIQENYGAVITGIVGIGAVVGVVVTSIKGGLQFIGNILSKKQEETANAALVVSEKSEAKRILTIRKGSLEVNKKSCEIQIMNLTIKLDVITNPETRQAIENSIAIENAELAGHVKELDEVNKELLSLC